MALLPACDICLLARISVSSAFQASAALEGWGAGKRTGWRGPAGKLVSTLQALTSKPGRTPPWTPRKHMSAAAPCVL